MKVLLEEKIRKETLINMPTGITSALIKEAAKCSRYASDLFIDYANIHSILTAWNLKDLRSHYLFGFRESGVDSEQMILAAQREYRAIYMLTLEPCLGEIEEIHFSLSKLGKGEKPEVSTDMLSKLSDQEVRGLWHRLEDIPMNPETEEMEAVFIGFPAGTKRQDIWEWFDTHYSEGVAALLYRGEEKYVY